jgi:hypothetical protein
MPPPVAATAAAPPPQKRSVRRLLRNAALAVAFAVALNEGCVNARANELADMVPLQEFDGLAVLWPEYESLADRSVLAGLGVRGLERALAAQTMVLADRVILNYRTPLPTVRENQWRDARDGLRRAVAIAPRNSALRGALAYCEGHLHRIDGEASKARSQAARAQQELTAAVIAFREAATLRPEWPDPFLGLARTFIAGLDDVDRGADALDQAKALGHTPTDRETTLLAEGYRARGDTLWRTAQSLAGLPQERDYLSRAAEAFREALARYSAAPGFGNAGGAIRDTQRRLERVEARRADLSRGRGWPWD